MWINVGLSGFCGWMWVMWVQVVGGKMVWVVWVKVNKGKWMNVNVVNGGWVW